MNCRNAQRRLLLAGTGELGHRVAERLESHVRGCAECQAFRAESERLSRTAATLPLPGPGSDALAAVHARLRARSADVCAFRIRRPTALGPFRLVLALAASALLLFGWLSLRSGGDSGDMLRIRAVLALVEDADEPSGLAPEPTDREEALRRLGRELLRSQGLLGFEFDIEV